MRSSRRRAGRGLALAAVALVLVAGPSAPSPVGRGSGPEPDTRYATPDGLVSTSARKDEPDPALRPLVEADVALERRTRDLAAGRQVPFLAPPGPDVSSPSALVVPDRGTAWDLAEVAALVPSAFTWSDDGALLLRATMVVARGAELVVNSATVPALVLSSGPDGYVTIRSFRATLRFRGHPGRRLTVRSGDPATGRGDDDHGDGRAYVLARGSEMDIRHATFSDLGYATMGETSGVAWTAATDRPATGGARDATFRRNYFGAYTAGAEGLVIARAAFLDNVVYGFDPHTNTNGTLVTDSVAARNGRHGFIFSQSCDRNVVRDSEAYLNGGTGFMIDDGIPPHGADRTSDHNTLLRVSSHDNGDVGIVVEGGTGNTVEQAVVTNNEDGIWVRDGAVDTVLAGNRVVATARAGVRLEAGLGPTTVVDTEIVGAGIGAYGEGDAAVVLRRLSIRGTAVAGLRLDGDQALTRFEDVEIRGSSGAAVQERGTVPAVARAAIDTGPEALPWARWGVASALHAAMVALWSAILVLPLGSRLLARAPLRRRRRPPAVAAASERGGIRSPAGAAGP